MKKLFARPLYYSHYAVLCISMMLMSLHISPVHAAEVRLNCDLRVLELSEPQRNQIRVRRQAYKNEQIRLRREQQNFSNQNNQLVLRNFFAKSAFDNQQAGQIAQQRHQVNMQQTISELSFYHDVFQMLTPKQKDIWLQKCMPSSSGHI